jgi:hypothetical protein
LMKHIILKLCNICICTSISGGYEKKIMIETLPCSL